MAPGRLKGADWIVTGRDLATVAVRLPGLLVRWIKRHPRISLIGGALLVVLGPLLVDLAFVVPWPHRKALGQVMFAIVAGLVLARVGRVRPGDRPMPGVVRPARGLDRVWPWLLAVLCGLLAWPMVRPGNLGFGDWDLFLGKIEAARRTILIYRQFPWWDPWTRGGFPLAANPQCGVIGLAMPFVLAVGPAVGMAVGTIACFMLAGEGARRLARDWIGDPMASFAVGLVYAINGAVLVAAVAAYHVSMCYPALPWMLHHVGRLHRSAWQGVGLGFWMAFSLLNGIQYFTVYMALIAGVGWLRALRVADDRPRLLRNTAMAVGVFLALSGWRIATTGGVYRDFPRVHHGGMDESLVMMVRHLLARTPAEVVRATDVPHSWETFTYIGPLAILLAIVSLRQGWRWWHTLTLVCAWLAIGSVHWYHPSYWLADAPLFATMHVVTRWRFMALLGVAMAIGGALAAWRSSDWPWVRALAPLSLAVLAGDYLLYGFQVLPIAFSVAPAEDLYPGPPLPDGSIVQVRQALGLPAISRGYGVIQGFEPLMGYDRGETSARAWRGDPRYRGEAWTDRGPIEPTLWTPNRIEFQTGPNATVWINQNPGSWWWINGRRAFPDWRCAEKERAFSALADESGRLVLEIRPRGLAAGWWLHGIGAAIVLLSLPRSAGKGRAR